ncbi:uncharacterized protein LOC123897360 [Trifolium pratense]|nr:uncharacterized protein LOC123897360 [Trifolium pratense]
MESKNFDSKNQVEVVEDLSTRVSRFSLENHISNFYSPLDDEVDDDDNMRNYHVSRENRGDSLSSVSTEEHSMNLTSLYPELPEESFERNKEDMESLADIQNQQRKYFYYDAPLNEDTGVWIPVSVPPMLEDDHKEWAKGFHSNGSFFPDDDMGWNQYVGGEKELTMWEVLVEILLAARGKVSSLASGDIHTCSFSWLTSHVLEQAWREMAQTLTEANFGNVRELIEAEPPKWLADSAAAACMLCGVRFHPIMCSRHHCRFCGGIFCGECSKGRSLMPSKFRVSDPQRVCDVCCVRLESVQPYLMDHVSNAAQLPTHDLTDLSTLRSWVNFPWGQTMEYEIYKATNTIKSYNRIGLLKPEKTIPDAILRQAKGLAIITVVKVGVVVTYNIGTGIVVARREDGSWSPPSAVSTFGVGWGAQAGGELTDFIIVLRTKEAVKTFSGNAHVSLGAGLSAAVGVIGRAVEADVRAGDGGYAACYTYSCSKGAFVGCSLEGSIVTTRTQENSRFYGSQSLSATDILLGSLPRPPAAAILYRALADLYLKIDGYH